MIFKRNVLAFAVLAVASGAAFASSNESYIDQVEGTDSVVQVEQASVLDQGQFSQVVQFTADASLVKVFQGITSDLGTIDGSDATAPAGVLSAILNGSDITAFSPTYAYEVLGNSTVLPDAANYANVLQDTTTGGLASVYQVDGDTDDLSTTIDTFDLADGSTMSMDAGDVAVTSAVAIVADIEYTAGAGNVNNIAQIYQGAVAIDRAGTDFGAAFAGDGAADEIALIVQSGIDHVALIYQAGDTQTAGVFQDTEDNDAYIAQYGGDSNTALIAQLAIGGFSTIYQSGTANTAVAYQYAEL